MSSVKRIKSKAKALRSLVGYRESNDYQPGEDMEEIKNHINKDNNEATR